MSPTITVTLRMEVREELVEQFVDGIPALVRETLSAPGLISARALRNSDSPGTVLFVEEWDSTTAFATYIAWRTERGDMLKLGQMLSKPPEIVTWSSVAHALS